MKKRLLAILLAIALVAGVAACATDSGTTTPPASETPDSGTDSNTQDPAPQEPSEVTSITGFIMFGNGTESAIERATWYTQHLEEKIGVRLEFRDASGASAEQMMQALMASGELPDIVGFHDFTFASNAAEAGLLLNLDDHKSQLPNVYRDFFNGAVAFSRENVSPDGNLYIMPTVVGEEDRVNTNPHMRWDIYQEIGAPAINTFEDYLPVMRQMLDAYPETPDGQRTFGLSIFPEWDGITMAFGVFMSNMLGTSGEKLHQFTELDVSSASSVPTSILDDGSTYKRILKFLYDANQLGVLDPDSATQQWDTVAQKGNDGRLMFSGWEWAVSGFNSVDGNEDNGIGYQPVWANELKIPVVADSPTGTVWNIGVSASSSNVDAALRYLDYFYSDEHVWFLLNGPEGVIWENGSDGKPVRTAQGWDIVQNDLDMPGGGKLGEAGYIMNVRAISFDTINPAYGVKFNNAFWDDVLAADPTALQSSWRDGHGGAINILQYAQANNMTIKELPAVNMIPAVPDNIDNLSNQIGEVIKTNSWLMVYANNEAEFESLWKDMQDKADGLGIEQVLDWARDAWQEAVQRSNTFS